MSFPSTIAGLNQLPAEIKRGTYQKIIPFELIKMFNLREDFRDSQGNDLLKLNCLPGSTDAEIALYPSTKAQDPILFGHITDSVHGQLHILLYGMNDVNSTRYDVDRLPDGSKTSFGIEHRNLEAEVLAFQAGLAPGQIYRGPHLFNESLRDFECFATSMGQELFFVEPLYYHVALIFEKYGFSYQSGKRFMNRIDQGFAQGGELLPLLDGSTPFRQPNAARKIRLRSWAIHDNILGEPFSNVTMYKYINQQPDHPCEVSIPW
ncbi:MAG: hypothetical protein MUO54_01510 [Anaerolineales bacterium]|nr:hypothetical protein [Anaerolineales bacterium]